MGGKDVLQVIMDKQRRKSKEEIHGYGETGHALVSEKKMKSLVEGQED